MDALGIIEASVPAGLLLVGATAGLGASFRLMRFPDLTVEGSFLLGAAVWAAACRSGIPTAPGAILAILAGAGCGAVTALLSRGLGIDRFLAGILVTAASYSLALIVLGVSNLGLFDAPDAFFMGFDLSGTPWLAAAAFAASILIIAFLYFRARLGIRSRMAAINPILIEEISGSAIPHFVLGLALTNALVAASGIAFSRYQGFVDVGMGQGILIVALASLAIGETVSRFLPTGLVVQTLVACLFGTIGYQIALTAALALGVPAALTKLVSALFVLAFLVAQSRRGALSEQPL